MVWLTIQSLRALTFIAFALPLRTSYAYDDYDYDTPLTYNCKPGGADVNTIQCKQCGPVSKTNSPLGCIGNYTGFDETAKVGSSTVTSQSSWPMGFMWISGNFQNNPGINLTNSSTAIVAASSPNHIVIPPSNYLFTYFDATKTPCDGYSECEAYGQIHEFYWGCSNRAGLAVACNLTITAPLIKNYTNGTIGTVKVGTTFHYKPTTTKNARMIMSNFTTVVQSHLKTTADYKIERYTSSHYIQVTPSGVSGVNLHLDNVHNSWWYKW